MGTQKAKWILSMRLLSVNITTVLNEKMCVQTNISNLKYSFSCILLISLWKLMEYVIITSAPPVVFIMLADNSISQIFDHIWCVFWTTFHVRSSLKSYNHKYWWHERVLWAAHVTKERGRQSCFMTALAIRFQFYCLCTLHNVTIPLSTTTQSIKRFLAAAQQLTEISVDQSSDR